nr:site-specific integrase [Chitinophaga polysaccharea]
MKEKVPHKHWNSKGEYVDGKPSDVKSINDYIDTTRERLKKAFRELEEKMIPFNALDVKAMFLGVHHTQRNKNFTLIKLIKKHEQECGPHLALGTMKNYKATEEYAANFIMHKYGKDDIHVAYLDFTFITEFENYIPAHPIKLHDPCTGNGTAKHIERLKKMVSWGGLLGWVKEDPFKKFQVHKEKNKKKKLKLHELVTIETKNLATEALIYARDLFVFGCYTGLAFVDVMQLRPEHFTISAAGRVWCSVYRAKSSELASIPILPATAEIIKKYMNVPAAKASGFIFPRITNQQINRLLKIIQEICEITISLTFHVARHTFATVIAIKNGVPVKTAQKIMGIVKASTMDVYTEIDEELIEEEIDKAAAKLSERRGMLTPMERIENYDKAC